MEIIFSGDMRLGKNTSQSANVQKSPSFDGLFLCAAALCSYLKGKPSEAGSL